MNLRDIIAGLRRTLDSRGRDVICAYLFGSAVRGEARASSDVDVAVLFAVPPPRTLEK